MSAASQPSVAIIGAGIGGLVLAHALRARGLAPELYEQSAELTEIGAAVALAANATRELDRLGLLGEVRVASTEPTELIHRDGHTGERVSSHAVGLGDRYRERFGGPYFGIHRADLQKALSRGLGGSIRLGHRLARLSESRSGVRLTFANGHEREVDVVVGADGVRSAVRRFVSGTPGVIYSKTSAFRGIVPTASLRSLPDPRALQFWMGAGAHLLHYPIGGAAEDINFFAVVEGPPTWPCGDRWIVAVEPGEATRHFSGWHPAVAEMIGAGWVDRLWGLFVVQQPRSWHTSRCVLIGDAAHGMLPHQGQGANVTIEDAVVLAELLAGRGRAEWRDVFVDYERLRKARTRAIQRASWATNTALHLLPGQAIDRRNAALARFPERCGWIHAFDALRSVRESVRSRLGSRLE
ncbi:MAG TPA: FAD-dependent monooxygenase [Gammaproteobacteria bacterium]|nr:FAD-dependent monooxygenase [Gammaproteobacteria bacterium]